MTKQPKPHPLTKFREGRGQTLEAFGQDIGVNKGMVWKWENNEAIPRPKYMRILIEMADGEISANDWYSGDPPSPQMAGARKSRRAPETTGGAAQ